MKMIVGLGNPGDQYAATRHNVGFRVVERIAATKGWLWEGKRANAAIAQGTLDGEKLLLVKPQTFMNLSGQPVSALLRFYKLDLADLLVICDDLDLPAGRVRLRAKGSAGGQRGVDNIITLLGTDGFARLRIGIGRPSNSRMAVVDYVLGAPKGDERMILEEGEDRAATVVPVWVREGTDAAMNRFNVDPTVPPKQHKPTPPKSVPPRLATPNAAPASKPSSAQSEGEEH